MANMHLKPGEAWEYCPRETLQRVSKILKDEFNLVCLDCLYLRYNYFDINFNAVFVSFPREKRLRGGNYKIYVVIGISYRKDSLLHVGPGSYLSIYWILIKW